MTLPPLPKPNVEAYHYDKYQMHEYGKQCREAALEEAAKACEDHYGEDFRLTEEIRAMK